MIKHRKISELCVTQSTSSATYTEITSFVMEFTSTTGLVFLYFDGATSDDNSYTFSGFFHRTTNEGSAAFTLGFFRDDVAIGEYSITFGETISGGGGGNPNYFQAVPASLFFHIDDPGPGTYTYSVKIKETAGVRISGYVNTLPGPTRTSTVNNVYFIAEDL